MAKYRTNFERVVSILNTLQSGEMIVSHLVRKVGISHDVLGRYLDILVKEGYIRSIENDYRSKFGNFVTYVLTGHGVGLLNELRDIDSKYKWINNI